MRCDPFQQKDPFPKSFLADTPFLLGVLPAIPLVLIANAFLPQQSIWTDETTVLSGLTLGPLELLSWLGGQFHPFDIPPDNAPPIGYWVGMLWVHIFGLTETSLRYLALLSVGIAVFVVYEACRSAFGVAAGLLGGFLFALSPNVIEQAVNIRSYPIYLLLSACAFYCFIQFLKRSRDYRKRWMFGVVLFSVLAFYTHFFGLLLAGGLFLSILVCTWRNKGEIKTTIAVIFIVGISTIGLVPFLIALFSHLGSHVGGSESGNIYAIVRLLYRQFGHPTLSVTTPFVLAAMVGFSSLALMAIIGRHEQSFLVKALLIALGAGLFIIVIGRFFVSSLMTEIRYNIWLYPGVSILLSSAIASKRRYTVLCCSISSVLLLGSYAYADSQFIRNGHSFAHSNYRSIDKVIQDLGPDRISIVHDGDVGSVFFPIRYTYGAAIEQFLVEAEKGSFLRLKRFPELISEAGISSIETHYLMLLRTEPIGATEIAKQIKDGKKPISPSVFQKVIRKSGQWLPFMSRIFISYYQTDMKVYRRIRPKKFIPVRPTEASYGNY